MGAPPFDAIADQPLVARFLSTALQAGTVHHAYLFAGPLGSGKTEAAGALARALLCGKGGCGACDECIRVRHLTHPDYHVIEPLGAAGYLVEQVAELVHDVGLTPMRGRYKVYLVTRADLLRGATANALLKTLEEPSGKAVFILLARTIESVLPTLASRCQVLPFRSLPEDEAVAGIVAATGVDAAAARIALAATGGSKSRAEAFARSSARREARAAVIETLSRLDRADDLDVLESVRDLFVLLKQPLDAVKLEQQAKMESHKGVLGKGALKQLEERHKRELTSRERETIGEAFDIMRSWLRDILLVRLGRGESVVNVDFSHHACRLAPSVSEAGVVRCLMAIDQAQEQIQYNVRQELALEAALFSIREQLQS
jgi:DNA polymerase-3 subunit delta'